MSLEQTNPLLMCQEQSNSYDKANYQYRQTSFESQCTLCAHIHGSRDLMPSIMDKGHCASRFVQYGVTHLHEPLITVALISKKDHMTPHFLKKEQQYLKTKKTSNGAQICCVFIGLSYTDKQTLNGLKAITHFINPSPEFYLLQKSIMGYDFETHVCEDKGVFALNL